MRIAGNDFNRSEFAGAFGDLGTLVPFVVGYITVNRLDPQGVLLGFGLLAVATGLYFKTPMSVQPMKAIATTAVAHPEIVTAPAIFVSAVVTGLLWLGLGLSGAVSWLATLTARPVVRGLILGLGLTFILEGVHFMAGGPLMAVGGAALTFVLLGRDRLPAMLALLSYGGLMALTLDSTLRQDLAALAPSFRLPALHIPHVAWNDFVTGVLVLAVPQAALTLGNAVIATADEHNALFPHRRVTVRLLALDHGLMNLAAALLGGVPMCRGAGGMAGHIRFGAHTGGAVVILGILLLAVALFFSDSVSTLFRLFPAPVLGVILFFGGMELASSIHSDDARADRVVQVVTAGITLWNPGVAYLTGLLLHHAARQGFIRLGDSDRHPTSLDGATNLDVGGTRKTDGIIPTRDPNDAQLVFAAITGTRLCMECVVRQTGLTLARAVLILSTIDAALKVTSDLAPCAGCLLTKRVFRLT